MDEALALIEKGLNLTAVRDLFSSDEVADILLDVRTAMVREPVAV